MERSSAASRSEPKATPPAKSFSTPPSPVIRKSSPIRPTPVRSSRSPTRTSATPAPRPRTSSRAQIYPAGPHHPRPAARLLSNWRANESLPRVPRARQASVAIAGIDTRKLTRILREKGAQSGCIMTGENVDRGRGGESGAQVPRTQGHGSREGGQHQAQPTSGTRARCGPRPGARRSARSQRLHVVAYDFGIKRNILRLLADRGCRMTVVPAQTTRRGSAARSSPTACSCPTAPATPSRATTRSRRRASSSRPTCRCSASASATRSWASPPARSTLKMKFGHHGANHPVQDLDTGRVFITSQNHGFAVDEATLPANVRATHRSLFDGSLQGLALTDRPAFSFQGHPEASPGPARPEAAVRALQSPDAAPPAGAAEAAEETLRRSRRRALMPKRTDIQSILIIGAGPIVIGQACEFDYSGAQACKALREEGYRVILVNSNPATIMTDPEMADAIYIEPVNWQDGGAHHREGAAGCAAADHGRADRAQHRARPRARRRAGEIRRRADRRLPRRRSTWPRTASCSGTRCARSASRRRARASRAASRRRWRMCRRDRLSRW